MASRPANVEVTDRDELGGPMPTIFKTVSWCSHESNPIEKDLQATHGQEEVAQVVQAGTRSRSREGEAAVDYYEEAADQSQERWLPNYLFGRDLFHTIIGAEDGVLFVELEYVSRSSSFE